MSKTDILYNKNVDTKCSGHDGFLE